MYIYAQSSRYTATVCVLAVDVRAGAQHVKLHFPIEESVPLSTRGNFQHLILTSQALFSVQHSSIYSAHDTAYENTGAGLLTGTFSPTSFSRLVLVP